MTDSSYVDKIINETVELTPKTGYNVVQFDSFSKVGEMLTLIDHVDTREEAEKIAKEIDSKEFPAYVYGPENE